MKRKRRLKRVSAFILAVALIIANCTPIFADEMSDAPEEVVPIIEPLTEEDLVVNDENNGDIVTPDVTPEVTKEVTPEITPVVPDITEGVTPEITKEVTPGITEEVTTYTVTFVGLDDEVIATVSVKPDDEAVEYPTAPEKDGFIFTGWDKEINVKDLTENVTVKALYDKVEANEVLVEREEQKVFGNKTVTVKGNIPEDAEVIISDVSSIEKVENLLSDEVASDENVTITVHEAYDIKIMLDGEVWQPCEHDSVVTISIDNINTDKELNVHRIDGNDVTAITPVIEEDNIIFETEHFTIFTVDTVNYNTDDGYFVAFGKVYNINDALKTNVAATKDGTTIYGYLFDDLYAVPTDGITVTDATLSPVWSDEGVNKSELSGKKLYIGDNVFSTIGSRTVGCYIYHAFTGCSGFTGDLVIPDSVTKIDSYAFDGCTGFTGNLVIPNSVTIIGGAAFRNCKFTGNLVIPDSVTMINESAFDGCTGFTGNLVIPDSVTKINRFIFKGCTGLSGDLVIPDSVTKIGQAAFAGCTGFTGTLNIPSSVTSIDYSAFEGCTGLSGDLVIPDSVTKIDNYTFRDCSGFTGNLVIPSSVTSIGSFAFNGCSNIETITVPSSVTSINTYAFSSKYVTLNNVTITNDIGDYSHFSKTMYTNAGRGESIRKLEPNVLYNDTLYYKELRDVTYTNDGATSGSAPEAHIGIDKGSRITLSTGTLVKESYILAGWTDGTNTYLPNATITVNDNMTLSPVWEIDTFTVNGITYKRSEALKTNVVATKDGTTIYGYLFDDLYAIPTDDIILTDVELKPTWSDSTINKTDLEGKKLFIGDNVFTSIGNSAFSACSGFTGTLNIPNGVTSIGNYAFANCSGFTGNLVIPDSVTSIGDSAFNKCSGLTGDLVIPDSVTSIGAFAFNGCSNIETITVPSSVTYIGSRAFSSKYVKLDNVTITNNESFTFSNIAGSGWTNYYANSGRGNSIKKLESNVLYNDTFARERLIETFQTNDGTTYNINDAIKKNIVATYNDTEIYGYLFDDLYAIPTDISRLNDVRSAGVALTINPVWSDEGVNKSELSGKKLYIGYNIFKSVGDNAFKDCHLTGSLDLGSTNINSIGAHVFENNNFTGWLNLPWTVTSLGEYAFAGNANLGGSISYNLMTVPDGLFKNCGISSIWLSSPTSIGAEAFKDTNINSIQIPSSVTSIGKDAFDGIMSVSFDNVTITNDIGDDTHFNTTMYANVGRGEGIRKLEPNVLYNDTFVDYQLFNVTYLTDGADSGEAPSGVIDWRSTEDYTIKDNNTLAKSGYTFKCWIDADGVTYNAGKVLKLTKTLNLSPVWDRIIPTYTVTYLGTGSTSGNVPSLSDIVNEGSEYTVKGKGTLVRDGYNFVCWSDGTNEYYPGDTISAVNTDITLSPVWDRVIPTYTVTYLGTNSTSGSVPTLSDTVNEGSEYTVKGKGTLARDGYTFKAWTDSVNTYYPGGTITVTADITLSPVWEEIPVVVTHTVTYTDNEATDGTAPSADTVTDGSRYTLKNKGTLKKSGYVFKGWKLGDTVYEAGDSIIVNTDITLTSVWEEVVINNSTNNTGSGTGNSNSTSTSTDSTNKSISADTDDNAPIIATTPVTKKVENNTMPILNNVPKKNVKVNKPVIVDKTEEAEESIEETEPVLETVFEVTEGTIINNDGNDETNESSEVTVTNKPKEKKMPIIPISAGAATILLGIVVYAYKKNIG